MKQIINTAKDKFSQIEELITLIDESLKSKSGKPYSLIEIALNQKESPLQALIKNYQYYNLINLYPNIVWSSIFLTAYSLFEYSLLEICKSFKIENENNITLQDLNHKGINKAKVFLKKIIKLNFPDEEAEWAFVKNSNLIRNCLIHRSGNLCDYDENHKIMKFINSVDTLNEMENKLIIEKDFPMEFIKNCISIIENLSKQF